MKKQGISLMVLILTVIIMVILAGTVIISLSNAGVINRSQGTVDDYNLKQVEELANLAWGEAYLAGNTTQTKLKEYVMDYLTKNGVDTTKYYFDVTTKGVIIKAYEENGWYKAWTCTNRVWSDEINPGQPLNGEVVAKLYTTDEENKYDLIISGKGQMGPGADWRPDEREPELVEYVRVGYKTFANKFRNVVIKEGVTNIGKAAFERCSIDSIQIADTVTTIENGAFAVCSLEKLVISKNVSSIDFDMYDNYFSSPRRAFPGSMNITIDENNKTYKIENKMILSKDGTKMYYGILSEDVGGLVIPEGGTREITVPSGVTIIGKNAVSYTNIATLNLSDTVTTIEDYAFSETSIRKISFPASVVNFGERLFYDYKPSTDKTVHIDSIKIYATSISSIGQTTFGYLAKSITNSKIYVLNEDVKNALSGTYDEETTEVIIVNSIEDMDNI